MFAVLLSQASYGRCVRSRYMKRRFRCGWRVWFLGFEAAVLVLKFYRGQVGRVAHEPEKHLRGFLSASFLACLLLPLVR